MMNHITDEGVKTRLEEELRDLKGLKAFVVEKQYDLLEAILKYSKYSTMAIFSILKTEIITSHEQEIRNSFIDADLLDVKMFLDQYDQDLKIGLGQFLRTLNTSEYINNEDLSLDIRTLAGYTLENYLQTDLINLDINYILHGDTTND